MAIAIAKHKAKRAKPYKKAWINTFIIPVAILQPIMTLPQIVAIFDNKSAHNISIFTWVAYNIASTFWLMYGIVHKERAIILTQVLWLIMQTAVIIGIVIYH